MLIHMGWVGSPPPAAVLAAVDRVRTVAADCEVMFHTDESAVLPSRREAVARFIPQWRSDVQRHAVLERYGGLWLDADVRLLATPTGWAASWDRYTATKLGRSPFIGTDIIYVPHGWGGWQILHDYMDNVLATAGNRVEALAIAGSMIRRLSKQHQDLFTVIANADVFPFSRGEFTSASVVARNFDPPAPPRPGLGDLATKVFSSVGITEARAQAVAKAVGLKDCGCNRRRAAMNRLGEKLGLPPGSTAAS